MKLLGNIKNKAKYIPSIFAITFLCNEFANNKRIIYFDNSCLLQSKEKELAIINEDIFEEKTIIKDKKMAWKYMYIVIIVGQAYLHRL